MLLPAFGLTALVASALAQNNDVAAVDWRGLTFANEADRLVDFSFAGAGALASASQPATIRLKPSGDTDDRTSDIQQALDGLPSSGGIVELEAGDYTLSGRSIVISGVGVTLRGELPAQAGQASATVLHISGSPRVPFYIGKQSTDSIIYRNETSTAVTDDYVGTGATSLSVDSASAFSVGDNVEIQRIISEQWINAEEMDGLSRHGENQTWIAEGSLYAQRRIITAVSNQTLTLNYGLTDPLNAALNASGHIIAYDLPDSYTRACSLESLTIDLSKDQSGQAINDPSNFPSALVFSSWGQGNWARQLALSGFIQAVHVQSDASQVTMQDVAVQRTSATNKTAGYPADMLVDGTQVLLHRCSTAGVEGSDSFTVATGSMVAGPVVALEHATSDARHMIQPHARWATGILIDNSLIGALELVNRGSYGSGQGWACAFSLGWNVISFGEMTVESPPLSANLCVGCMGTIDADQANYTSFIEPQKQISPPSLFAAQLAERSGQDAADAILSQPATKAASSSATSSADATSSASTSTPSPTASSSSATADQLQASVESSPAAAQSLSSDDTSVGHYYHSSASLAATSSAEPALARPFTSLLPLPLCASLVLLSLTFA